MYNEFYNDNKMYISTRGDRYGSNVFPWISAIYYCNQNNITLYHNCNNLCNRYNDNIFHKLLLKKTKTTTNNRLINNDINNISSWCVDKLVENIVNKNNNKSFPDIFYKSQLYNEINIMYDNKYNDVLLTKYKHSTIIHVRLDDMYNNKMSDSHQEFIGINELRDLSINAYNTFKKNIYVITSPNKRDYNICYNVLNKIKNIINIKNVKEHIISNIDIDKDIYIMKICKVLILSKSTFPFIAALLNENISYTYYKSWIHYDDIIGRNSYQCNKINNIKLII